MMTTQKVNEIPRSLTEAVEVFVLGSADAFNTGGRANSAYWVKDTYGEFAIDFGPTALAQAKRLKMNFDALDTIMVTHLHGDHIGGLPMLILHLHYDLNRTKPLTIVGPPSIEQYLLSLWSATYPSTRKKPLSYELRFETWHIDQQWTSLGRRVSVLEAVHDKLAEPFSLKIETGSQRIAFSGDTGWQDQLTEFTADCDLFVCEATNPNSGFWGHMSVEEHRTHRKKLHAKKLVLSHLNDAALKSAISDAKIYDWDVAYDGMIIQLS